jgi:acetyltransferase-like isoleucine patch superfamily enzyme
MKLFLLNILYHLKALKIIDWVLSKTISAARDIHVFVEKRKLEEQGSTFGNNLYIDPSVKIRIHKKAKLVIGDNVKILNDSWLIADEGDELLIGNDTFISQNVVISGSVKIGHNTLIAGYVSIIDANHNFSDVNKNIDEQGGNKADILIGNDIWIGTHSVVLQGVVIGSHSVIGANSTVTNNIEEYSIAIGSPAKTIKKRK